MRTAEEILDKNLGPNLLAHNTKESVIEAINEARKEVIEELYEIIKEENDLSFDGTFVNKDFFYNLIKEIP